MQRYYLTHFGGLNALMWVGFSFWVLLSLQRFSSIHLRSSSCVICWNYGVVGRSFDAGGFVGLLVLLSSSRLCILLKFGCIMGSLGEF